MALLEILEISNARNDSIVLSQIYFIIVTEMFPFVLSHWPIDNSDLNM